MNDRSKRRLVGTMALLGVALLAFGAYRLQSEASRMRHQYQWPLVASHVEDHVEGHVAPLHDLVGILEDEAPSAALDEEPRELQAVLARLGAGRSAILEIYTDDPERELLARISAEEADDTAPTLAPRVHREVVESLSERHDGEHGEWHDHAPLLVWCASDANSDVWLHVVRPMFQDGYEPEEDEDDDHEDESDDEAEEDEDEDEREVDDEEARHLILYFRTRLEPLGAHARIEVLCAAHQGSFVSPARYRALSGRVGPGETTDAFIPLDPEPLEGEWPRAAGVEASGPLLRVYPLAASGALNLVLLLLGGAALAGAVVLGWMRSTREGSGGEAGPAVGLTSEAAHEMRTPLTVMRGKLEVALRREREPEAYQRALRDCLTEVDAMQHLQDAILLLSRTSSDDVQREPVDLVDLVRAEVDRVAEAAPERDVVLEAPPGLLATVRGDPSLLARAVGNLLDNAAAHSVPSGSIRASVATRGGAVEVVVEDDGPGIPPKRHARVFERFYRGPDVGRRGVPGSGLGLPIVARMAQLHGGSVSIDPRVHDRSRFVLRLPLMGHAESSDSLIEL